MRIEFYKVILKIIFFWFFFSPIAVYTQENSIIKGTVQDSLSNPIPNASVTISHKDSKIIDYFTFTDNIGIFLINKVEIGEYELKINALGYNTWSDTLDIKDSISQASIKAVLMEKVTELDEVMVSAEEILKIKKDTISVLVKAFADGNESSLEDLLKKIPGLNVDLNGTIKIGNQEIEKLMIDGDDFFERGYKILSKNMPVHPIESIDIIKNFSNNNLLRGIEHTNKVALNIKLKEESKRVWFGNIEQSFGVVSENRYQTKGNLMNFGKKNKYYFLGSLNNLGEDTTGDISQLVQPFRSSEPEIIGDNETVDNIISLNQNISDFKANRTNFNNNELISLNAIFNPYKKLKIKTLGFLNWDEKDFYKNSIARINVNETSFINNENYLLNNAEKTFFGKTDIYYEFSNSQKLESTTKYKKADYEDFTNLEFNGTSTLENLQHVNNLFDQKFIYTNNYKDKEVLLITGRFINEKRLQNYSVNQFFYDNLFPEINADNVFQSVTNSYQFLGFNAQILNRINNGSLLDMQIGISNRQDNLLSSFSLLEDSNVIESPKDFQNFSRYKVNDLYAKSSYRWDLNGIGIFAKLEAHQILNRLNFYDEIKNQNVFFINTNVGFDWEINQKNKVIGNFYHGTTNAKILDVYNNKILTGFRNFDSGTGELNQLEAKTVNLNYQLGNWNNRFFANTFLTFTKNQDYFSSNNIIEQNYSISEKILTKDRKFLKLAGNLDYYLKFMLSNIKLNLDYTKSDFMNSINNAPLRTVVVKNYQYGFELRSGFNSVFNYHLGTKWIENSIETNIINDFTNRVSFADFSLVFKEKLNISIRSEKYTFGNFENNQDYYFLDFDLNAKVSKNKFTLGLTGKNLLNTNSFTNILISDIGTTTTQYRLLPRFVLLKFEYRF